MAERQTAVLKVGVLSAVDLDPRTTQDWLSALVLRQVYETPFAVPDPGQSAKPQIFGRPLRQIGQNYRAQLRDDLRFSDGTAVTAAHVVASLSGTEAFREMASVSSESPGGNTIVFALRRANARFDLSLCQQFCAILLEKDGRLLGSGPYMLTEDSTPDRLRLVKNPHYRAPAAIDEIEITIYSPDPDGRPRRLLEALQNGEADLTNALSRRDIRKLQGLRTWLEPGNSTAILFFNNERPFLREARARKAIALGIDRAAFAQEFFDNPHAFVASGLMPPNLGTWRDRLYPDLQEARALLSAVWDPVPEALSLLVMPQPRPYLPKPRLAAEFLVRKLAELGIQVRIEMIETLEEYDLRIRNGDYDLFLSGWIADTPDPADYLESTLSSKLIPRAEGSVANRSNLSRFEHPEMDAALSRFHERADASDKAEITRILSEEVPLFPLLHGWIAGAYSWRIQNCELSALGIPKFASMRLKS